MITLNEFLNIVTARRLRLVVPVTPRLKARIDVATRDDAEFCVATALYGEYEVFSSEPVDAGTVMEIELTKPAHGAALYADNVLIAEGDTAEGEGGGET